MAAAEDRPGTFWWTWRRMLATATLAALTAWGTYEVISWPDVAGLAARAPETTAFIERYRARQRVAGRSEAVAWRPVEDERISAHLKRAAVAAEDMEFFSHQGFSSSEMKAALREAVRQLESPRGASTITQQLAKNLWLTPSRNPARKLREAVLTRQLEHHLSKRRILALYLNVVEFGPGVYGAEAAARTYFGKPAAQLTEREAAELAAGLPRPSSWHPGVESRAYRRYVEEIERRMAAAPFLRRAVGGGGPPAADSLPLRLPDRESLLTDLRERVAPVETTLVESRGGPL